MPPFFIVQKLNKLRLRKTPKTGPNFYFFVNIPLKICIYQFRNSLGTDFAAHHA